MRIRKEAVISDEVQFLAQIGDAMAHPVRIMILQYVAQKNAVRNDVCNQDLVKLLPYAQATISQHVKKLVQAGLLQIERQDKFSIYYLDRDVLNAYLQTLTKIKIGETNDKN